MTATALVVDYRRPPLYAKQERALFAPTRYAWVEASTKSGKTVGCIAWLVEQACLTGAPGRNYWWVAPIRRQAGIAFRRTRRAIPPAFIAAVNLTDQTITLINGAVIWFLDGFHPDSLYGEDVYAAVIDEASRVKADSWFAVRSTLTATRGPVRLIGNVKGRRNWFYRGCRAAETGLRGHTFSRINAYDAAAGGIFPRDEIDDARQVLPEAVFRELYLAEPGEEGDSFFATDRIRVVDGPPDHCARARGWDFAVTAPAPGKDPDWTVGALIGETPEMTYVIDIARDRKAPDGVLDMLEACALRDGDAVDIVLEEERGAAGKTMVASIRRAMRELDGGRKVRPAAVSGDKAARALALAVRVNRGQCRIVKGPWNDTFLAELDEFPDVEGTGHDDQVDAAAHAFNYLDKGTGGPRLRYTA